MDPKYDAMPINSLKEEVARKKVKDFFDKCKRIKFSASIVQPQQGVEVSDMGNKVPDVLPHKLSAGKDPMNSLINYYAVQSSVDTHGCTKGHAHQTLFTGNESARSRLPKICRAIGWKEPLYYFEEQGPQHNKIFRCKVAVHVEGISDPVLESFGDPRSQKKAAQEHAAQGAVWYLARSGHVK